MKYFCLFLVLEVLFVGYFLAFSREYLRGVELEGFYGPSSSLTPPSVMYMPLLVR